MLEVHVHVCKCPLKQRGCEHRDGRHTNSAIKPRWTTTTDAIFTEGLDGAFFNGFVASKAGKIVASKIEHLLPGVDELGSGSVGSRDHWNRCEIHLLFSREWNT